MVYNTVILGTQHTAKNGLQNLVQNPRKEH
jgi:hypothetical protein